MCKKVLFVICMISISFAQNLVPYRIGDKWGYAEFGTKKLVIPAIYDEAKPFNGDVAVIKSYKKYGLIDKNGSLVSEVKYDEINDKNHNFFDFKINDKYGYINQSGREITECKYDCTWDFYDGYAESYIGDDLFYIDSYGTEITAAEKINQDWIKHGLIRKYEKNKIGFSDLNNNTITACIYDSVYLFGKDYVKVKSNQGWGLVSNQGQTVITPQYQIINHANDEVVVVKQNDKYGVVDMSGKIIIPIIYNYIFDFSEDVFTFKNDSGYGFIDVSGEIIIPAGRYKGIEEFSEGLARVQNNYIYGFIDRQGNEVIPLKYNSAYHFKNGRAYVGIKYQYGYIDRTGKEIIPLKYSYADWSFKNGIANVDISTLTNKISFSIDTLGNEYYEKYKPHKAKKYPEVSVWKTEVRKLKSKINNEEYSLFIYAPRNYYQTNKTYPVVYLLDADYTFGIARDAVESMSFAQELPEMIIIGIAYGKTFDDWFSKRTRDLTPSNDTNALMFPGGGGCDKFLRVVNEEIISYVNKNFRVVANERTLVGYSFGALFGFYSMFKSPQAFNQYFLISPSLWWDNNMVFNWETEFANTNSALKAKICLTVGGDEVFMLDNIDKMVNLLKSRNYPSLNLSYWQTPGQTHYSVFPTAFAHGMKAIFK